MSDLKKKIFKPIYFLMGEESFYIDEITNYMEKNCIPEEERSFNQTILYGKDIDLAGMLNQAKRFPMMSNYNLVIVKEAQNLKGIDGSGTGEVDPFMLYVEKPLNSTILVINYRGKSLDKRKKIFKSLEKNAAIFESAKIYDDKVGAWITTYLKAKGYNIEIKAAELMANFLGNDLSKVANEIEKLCIVLPKGATINLKDIEENVGISKDFNVFELQDAIGKRDFYRSNLIVTHMGQNPKTKSIIPMLTMLYSFFTKILLIHSATDKSKQGLAVATGINQFFINDYLVAARNFSIVKTARIVGILREYDAKSKGIDAPSVDDSELMRELVFRILHV